LDSEYVILSVLLIALGVTGILLFNGPKTPAGDSCFCIIPSPEAGAMQGTASILLIFGVMFIPIAILKGGAPSFGRGGPKAGAPPVPTGRVFTPIPIVSGRLFGLGALLIFIGVDLAAVPGFFVLDSRVLLVVGVILAIIGGLLVYRGTQPKPGASKGDEH